MCRRPGTVATHLCSRMFVYTFCNPGHIFLWSFLEARAIKSFHVCSFVY
uniref:Uncharacterized protein n=1 Tax=Arundo donax TaxID=35708 RepID=A0A0A9CDN4_ARUDO